MEDYTIQDKPGLFSKFIGIFARTEEPEDDHDVISNETSAPTLRISQNYRYTVTVRRQISSFDDAMAAANGLKLGIQQILNLADTDPITRQKIVDFMCGVNYAQEGTWEEIGDNIFLIVPANAYVEVAPATPRMSAVRN